MSLFITVEGTDGSGKTTQIRLISEYLRSKGYEVLLTREPGGTRIGEKIRDVTLDKHFTEMDQNTEILLYSAARAQLVSEIIKPALENNKIVICDRFLDSTYAYQGFGRGISLDIIEKISNFAIQGIMPDITFFFDLNPETAIKRRRASSSTDRIENEKMDFHTKVYEGYKSLVEMFPDRIKRVDASRIVDDIWADVKLKLDDLLKGYK